MSKSLRNKLSDNKFLIYSTDLENVFFSIREFSQWSARPHKGGEGGLKRRALNQGTKIEVQHVYIIYIKIKK